jgi:AcrR family transcriptional regulator
MTAAKNPRGRPKLAPEDNETRERILKTAEQLFADKGFNRVTLRELTEAAGANLAAVNYYFGSKDQLLIALVRRAARLIRKERQRLLEEATAATGGRAGRVRKVLYALLAPAIVVPADTGPNSLYGTLIARTRADGPEELIDLLERQTGHLEPYAQALRTILSDLPPEEIYWRLHFVLNIEHAVHTELNRLHHLSKGLCDTRDREAILTRIIDFSLPGMVAPVRKEAARAPGRTR